MAVVRNERVAIPRDTGLLARWRKIPTAIIADVSRGAALIDPLIRPLRPPGQQPHLFGFAVTARCEVPDFGAVLHALDGIVAGDVLVIAARGSHGQAMLGGILGGYLRRKSAAGVVCDGAVRDVMELAAWDDFSVFSRFITPRGPTGVDQGAVNEVINIGGRSIAPGELMIGDDDGVVALTADMLRTLIEPAEAKLKLEDDWITALGAGKTVADTFGLRR